MKPNNLGQLGVPTNCSKGEKSMTLDKTVLQDLYVNQRKTQKEIAEDYSVARSTIQNWMKKYNIPSREGCFLPYPISEQLKVKIKIDENDCWNWTGKINKGGYGYLSSRGKYYLAHRISYEFFVGEIPDGLTIDHLCRNRRCVNPNHLEVVTLKENISRGERARQTHCLRGHPLFGNNLYIDSNHRRCRKCGALRTKLYRERKYARSGMAT